MSLTIPPRRLKEGMRVDMRDEYFIWSAARVQHIHNDSQGNPKTAKIRFEGWGQQWDEKVKVGSDRIAPLYSFTKEIKCFVTILPKKITNRKPSNDQLESLPSGAVRKYSYIWPARVQVRMPHPVDEEDDTADKCLEAENSLRAEPRLYFRPYLPHLLPKVIHLDNDGGAWLSAQAYLRPWRDDPQMTGLLHPKFMAAFDHALKDNTIVGFLRNARKNTFDDGSLLLDQFRVFSCNGAEKRDGSLTENNVVPLCVLRARRDASESSSDEELEDDSDKELISSEENSTGDKESSSTESEAKADKKPAAVAGADTREAEKQDNVDVDLSPEASLAAAASMTEPRPEPTLPPPIVIKDPIYPGVTFCESSDKFAATVYKNGNPVMLGEFPTQTQAYQATLLSVGDSDLFIEDVIQARQADLLNLPIASIIAASEEQYKPENNFSMHQWTMEMIERTYHQSNNEGGGNSESITASGSSSTAEKRKSKRKGAPRKLDVKTRRFL